MADRAFHPEGATRKFDPGPAFPMQRFLNLLDSRGVGALDNESAAPEFSPEGYRASARLNIREGPGTDFEWLAESPLPMGTELIQQDEDGNWVLVTLAEQPDVRGWVHSGCLQLV